MAVISDPDNTVAQTCWDDCASMHPARLNVCEESVEPGTGRSIGINGGVACDACCAAVDEERIQKFNSWTI